MITKRWCLILGGVLTALGATRTTPNMPDMWEVILTLGLFTLAFGLIQELIDYADLKGWWK